MSPEPPPALRAALERELSGVSRKALAERAAKLSAHYRAGETSTRAVAEPADALAYALARLPATYAACAAVFAEARRMAPGFAPSSLLDAGAGPATASWAAVSAWPELSDIRLVDRSRLFLDLASRIASEAPQALRRADVRVADLAADHTPADLVAASYALAETRDRLEVVVAALWGACRGLLVLVEPGTPDGFERIRAARGLLIGAGATMLAPCPHDGACPIAAPDWCHFVQRLPRTRDHRLAKAADAPFEDEKFAYLVAGRPSLAAGACAARVLGPPRAGKPGITLRLCTQAGIETRFVPRRDKPAHAAARRLAWGDAVSPAMTIP